VAKIRIADASDAGAIAAIYRPVVEATPISFETIPPDPNEMVRRIGTTTEAYPWLVCDLGGQVAGYAYATKHRERAAYRWSVDTSVYIDARYRRSGVGRGLYTSLFGILAAQGFFNAYAGITLPNPSSVGLHEVMGFRKLGIYERVGYKCAWYDVGWWQLTLRPHMESPGEPLSLAEARTRRDWDTLLASGEPFVRRDA
jgi:phosphinothricin acetyltransferase